MNKPIINSFNASRGCPEGGGGGVAFKGSSKEVKLPMFEFDASYFPFESLFKNFCVRYENLSDFRITHTLVMHMVLETEQKPKQ